MDLNDNVIYSPDQAAWLEKLQTMKEKRCAAIEKRQKKGAPFAVITGIEYKRIILTIRGEIRNAEPNISYGFRFVTMHRDLCFYPDHVDIDSDGKFTVTLNILCSNNEKPIQTGMYDFVLFEEYKGHRGEITHKQSHGSTYVKFGDQLYCASYDDKGFMKSKKMITSEYPSYICGSAARICTETADNPWNFKVNKTKNSWMHIYACEDLDDTHFYLNVNYMPLENYGVLFINSKMRLNKLRLAKQKFVENCYKFIADMKLWTVKKAHKTFKKFAKHEGNIVLFCSASRAEIGGNEKFIYDRMIERGLDEKFKFRFDFKSSIKTNRSFYKMLRFVYYLATSDIIVLDDYYPIIYDFTYDIRVKVVQVWHACGAFKTVGFERVGNSDAPHFNSLTHKCYTHVIVSSELSARHNAEAFCISENKFYNTGIPRTDLFFSDQYKESVTKRMFEEFKGCKNRNKVYLYAPTFRGTNANDAYFPFGMIDLDEWGRFLEKENSALIVKMHPFVKNRIDIPEKYKDRIFDAGDYREINDILFISDVLITDYSSVIYEMSLLNRPMLFYAFDRYSYEYSRGFYESYEDTVPGKIVQDFDELLDAMREQNYDFYKVNGFVKKNFTHTDGKSTDRVIDEIFLK